MKYHVYFVPVIYNKILVIKTGRIYVAVQLFSNYKLINLKIKLGIVL